ncbi:MAG: ATP-binding protein [Planctomycetota bacterium]
MTLLGVASLLVGWNVLESWLFPSPSVGLHHFLLTVQAGLVTAAACLVVYGLMRRHQRELSRTVRRLAELLEGYMADPGTAGRFENHHRRHCRQVLRCDDEDCPMYDRPAERCWQGIALGRSRQDRLPPAVEIARCHECEVFRQSAPDELSALGEDINNLFFLLRAEARETERLRAEMVEREKKVSIGELASGLAHEIGNPLSSISSVVQVLKRAGIDSGTSEQLDLIERHIRRISDTVHQVAKLSHPGDEQWALIDVRQALVETVRLVSFDERSRDVEIVFDPTASLPRSYGLPGQIEQVFLNLALNALDAMPGGGTLTVDARHAEDQIVVRFRDTGMGIPPQTGQRVFDPFFTTKEPGRGTGLGLAVSYTIVEKLGGTIEYDSTEGGGTVFTVRLPVLDRPRPFHAQERR